MKGKKLVLAALICAFSTTAPVSADWTKAASLLGSDKPKTEQSSAFNSQDIMLEKFTTSSTLISEAQLSLAKSFKLDELAAKIDAENKAKDGPVDSKSRLDTIRQNGEVLRKEQEMMEKKGVKLDAESKQHYLNAIIPYVSGLVGTKSVVDAAPGFISSAKDTIASASFTEKLSVTDKLSVGLYIAKELPAYAQDLLNTSNLMMSFAKSNDIEVPEDATKALTGITFE